MEIIKDAFVEGRETQTDWEKSKAKKNQLKLEVAAENLSLMKSREFNSAIPLHQICPDTGKVLRTFPSRIAAARYIVNDILKRPEKNPLSITGNMEMCMRGGWKAYGFYWKLATPASLKKYDKTPVNAQKVYIGGGLRSEIGRVAPSIQAAADMLGVSAKVIARAMKPGTKHTSSLKRHFVQEYNPTPITKEFVHINDAASYANCHPNTMRRVILQKRAINNVTYVITGKTNPVITENEKAKYAKYAVYKGKKLVARVNSYTDVAKITGGHRTKVAIKIGANQPLGEFGQYRVVTRT